MLKSPLRYVGAKNWATDMIKELLSARKISTFVDCFCGSAVVPLNIEADRIVINDFDRVITNLYENIKSNPVDTWTEVRKYIEKYNSLQSMEEKCEYYYSIRELFNNNLANKTYNIDTAATFVFINKSCFNAVKRYNKRGTFNVPAGKKKSIALPEIVEDMEYVNKLSAKFKEMNIVTGDFEDCINWDTLDKDAAVVIDSPYVDTYSGYTSKGFDMAAHERVAKLFEKLAAKGIRVIAFNSTDCWVYDRYKDFNIKTVSVRHAVNRNANNRDAEEVMITCNI